MTYVNCDSGHYEVGFMASLSSVKKKVVEIRYFESCFEIHLIIFSNRNAAGR